MPVKHHVAFGVGLLAAACTDSSESQQCPQDVTVLVTEGGPRDVAYDADGTLFWTDEVASAVVRLDGSAVVTVASSPEAPSVLGVGGGRCVWAGELHIYEAPCDGGEPEVRADTDAPVVALDVDADRIVWADSAGKLWSESALLADLDDIGGVHLDALRVFVTSTRVTNGGANVDHRVLAVAADGSLTELSAGAGTAGEIVGDASDVYARTAVGVLRIDKSTLVVTVVDPAGSAIGNLALDSSSLWLEELDSYTVWRRPRTGGAPDRYSSTVRVRDIAAWNGRLAAATGDNTCGLVERVAP